MNRLYFCKTYIYLKDLTILINDCLESVAFPDELKLTNSSTFGKGKCKDKVNYIPVSILSYMSRGLERILFK